MNERMISKHDWKDGDVWLLTALGNYHVNLHCTNGQHDFGTNAISEDFVRCPREVAFEKIGI